MNDPIIIWVTLGLVVIFGVCAAIQAPYAKFSLSIALGFYILNLVASLLNFSMLAIFGLFIKGFIIYFIVKGLIAAFKITDILKKMERHDLKPYKN